MNFEIDKKYSQPREQWRAAREEMERLGVRQTVQGPKLNSQFGRAIRGLGHRLEKRFPDYMRDAYAKLPLSLTQIDVPCPHGREALDGLTILHMTDFHLANDWDQTGHILDVVENTFENLPSPDLLLMTGDYLRDHTHDQNKITEVAEQIYGIAYAVGAKRGNFVTLGNHDPHAFVPAIEQKGLHVLANQVVRGDYNGVTLRIAGSDDPARFFTQEALKPFTPGTLIEDNVKSNEFGIALVHTPELAEEADAAGYHLYLAGHTHGGQICLQPGKPIVTSLVQNQALASGRWEMPNGMVGYTSRGVGASDLPIRINCPAEMTLFTLHAG